MVIKVAGATGATSRYTATDRELLKEAGDGTLQIRDMHLVNPNARGQNMGFLVRQDSVLFSLFGVKALLKSDACYLLEALWPWSIEGGERIPLPARTLNPRSRPPSLRPAGP